MLSHEFMSETAEENQILNIVADYIAKYIYTAVNRNPSFLSKVADYIAGSPFDDITLFGKPLSGMGVPKITDPTLNAALRDLKIVVLGGTNTTTLASYVPSDHTIEIHYDTIVDSVIRGRNDMSDEVILTLARSVIAKTLVHELQHAVDSKKSNQKAFSTAKSKVASNSDAGHQAYLRLPYEVNARFTEALYDIGRQLKAGDIRTIIDKAFKAHQLNVVDQKQYNRLLARAYKFYQAEIDSPKSVNQASLAKRAKAWILGGPNTDTIS